MEWLLYMFKVPKFSRIIREWICTSKYRFPRGIIGKNIHHENHLFITRYSVPSHPISIPRSSKYDDLQSILRELLEGRGESISFDFLINNEFIEGTLDDFLTKKKFASVLL